jgi:germination protein M
MFTKSFIKKVCLCSFCLIVAFIIYLFPKYNTISLTPNTSYNVTSISDVIYLLDRNNYVSRINISLKGKSSLLKAIEVLDYLTINSKSSKLLPTNFSPVIPANTKVLNTNLDNKVLSINFSNDFLKCNDVNKMIESIVYSLTSIDGIDKVSLSVDGNLLNKLPNSNEYIDNPLDKSYGINKSYDIDSIKNTSKTTIYYLSKDDSFNYYIPITKVSNVNKEKVEVIIKELTSSPIFESNLKSYLDSETKLNEYKLVNNELILSFNNKILAGLSNDDIKEEITYAINLSIKDNYDVSSVSYIVDNKKIATFDLKSLE